MTCSAINGSEVAQVVGALIVLAATCGTHPSMIIKQLTGVLWTDAEAADLMAAAVMYDPLNERIIADMVARPSP